MTDLGQAFRDGFGHLLADMPEPPSWESVSARRISAPARARAWSPLKALAGGAAAVLLIGVVLVAIRGGTSPVAADVIDYVKIQWSDQNDLRCLGMDIREHAGADGAIIEIWGPTADNMVREDATTPDGATHTLIREVAPDRGFPVRAWASYQVGRDEESPFRITDCVEQREDGTSSYAMGQDPLAPFGGTFDLFLTDPDGPDMAQLIESLSGRASVSPGVWLDRPTINYLVEDTYIADDLGTQTNMREFWFDDQSGRLVRLVYWSDIEVLGTGTRIYELLETSTVALNDTIMNTSDLSLIHDMSEAMIQLSEDDPSDVTTSIAPLGETLMSDAVEIDATQIPAALLSAVAVEEGDQIYEVSVEGGPLIIRLRAANSAHMFALDCAALVSVELPAGWFGTCVELSTNGKTQSGLFSYAEADETD